MNLVRPGVAIDRIKYSHNRIELITEKECALQLASFHFPLPEDFIFSAVIEVHLSIHKSTTFNPDLIQWDAGSPMFVSIFTYLCG